MIFMFVVFVPSLKVVSGTARTLKEAREQYEKALKSSPLYKGDSNDNQDSRSSTGGKGVSNNNLNGSSPEQESFIISNRWPITKNPYKVEKGGSEYPDLSKAKKSSLLSINNDKSGDLSNNDFVTNLNNNGPANPVIRPDINKERKEGKVWQGAAIVLSACIGGIGAYGGYLFCSLSSFSEKTEDDREYARFLVLQGTSALIGFLLASSSSLVWFEKLQACCMKKK